MKYKAALLVIGVMSGSIFFGGCSGNAEENSGDTVYGEVISAEDDVITIQTGTTDEEMEITITEDTTIEEGMMGGPGGNQDGETPPEAPPESPAGDLPEGEDGAPEGEAPEGEAPAQMASEITVDDIEEGDTVQIALADDGKAEKITVMSEGMGGGIPGGQMAEEVESYDAVTEYTEDTETNGETFTSSGTDENAIHIYEGANVTISKAAVTKQSDDSTGGDASSFYGVGAALLTTEGTAFIKESQIDTDAAGGAGIFSYGDSKVYVSDTTITTRQDTSGGIHAAGGGTLYAWDVDAETNGTSSAAVRSDRGGGTMVIDGGSYTSNGADSPAVYCTADIAAHNALLTSTSSEAVCIEGLNTLKLFDCTLSGAMPEDERNDCIWNIILYQSMSGDSEVGNSTFSMSGGTLKAQNGGIFYTTNTESTITLSGVEIEYPAENDFFLKCTGNQNERGWGTEGSNGADCVFTASNQEMEGDILWDTISSLDFYMTEESVLKGAVINDETCVKETGDGTASITIDKNSKWTVTGDSTLTSLSCAGTI